jgi:transcriptional regulator with XRE-family HTH domain
MARPYNRIVGFSDRLCEAIDDSGLTTPQICERCRIERKAFYEYKRGEYTPPVIFLARLCSVLHVSADWLLGLKSTKQ